MNCFKCLKKKLVSTTGSYFHITANVKAETTEEAAVLYFPETCFMWDKEPNTTSIRYRSESMNKGCRFIEENLKMQVRRTLIMNILSTTVHIPPMTAESITPVAHEPSYLYTELSCYSAAFMRNRSNSVYSTSAHLAAIQSAVINFIN